VVFIFHDTLFLPIMVAAMIAVMLFELLRAVKLEKCLPILCAAELAGVSVPLIAYMTAEGKAVFDYTSAGLQGGPELISAKAAQMNQVIQFAVILAAAFVIFLTWLKKHKEIRYEQVFFALASMVLVPQAMSTMVRIDRCSHHHGLFLLIMGLCGAWIADTGAYFTGVALGKHKLCPEISPKKTIEGFVGGITFTGIAYAVAFSLRSGFTAERAAIAFVIGAVCAVIGTVGDLSASMVKRQIGFKDYGKIMPGHGGLMDRFDSVLFVLPTFYIMIAVVEDILEDNGAGILG
jgi:phosphatidate cytidylyltransferase